jgi:GNAT superfamily N-acetyltransferase
LRGCTRVEGPVNLHVLYGYRWQVSGEERRPFALEPRNPPYYPRLVEALGFAPTAWWRTWDISGLALQAWRLVHRAQAGRNRRLEEQGYYRRPVDLARWDDELRILHRLTMASYAEAWRFAPLDFDEYARIHAPLVHVPGVRGVFLCHRDHDDPVGFGFAVDEQHTGILHSFGILPAHRGKGLAHLVYQEAFDHLETHDVRTVIGALAKEGSTKYSTVGAAHRRYAVYARELAGAP